MNSIYKKGYHVSSSSLLLNFSGLYQNVYSKPQQQFEIDAKGHLLSTFFKRWKLTFAKCYLARGTYWETVVSYPTGNILETKTIIQSEIGSIAPLSGTTYAFIINLSKNHTTVLYCCFPSNILEHANKHGIWRILPETLPFYRSLFFEKGAFLIEGRFQSLDAQIEQANDTDISQFLIRISDGNIASLSLCSDEMEVSALEGLDDYLSIDNEKYLDVASTKSWLELIDFVSNCYFKFQNLKDKLSSRLSYAAGFIISFFLAFIISKSIFISWQEDNFKEKISVARTSANESIKLTTDLKQAKVDIEKLNNVFNQQTRKSYLLQLLDSLINDDNELIFSSINISPSEIYIIGTVKSATVLLSRLSEIEEFEEVQFVSPPAEVKDLGERFNIKLMLKMSNKEDSGKVL